MDEILSLLGLSQRANKVLYGENLIDNMGKVKLLFLGKDASDKTKERFLKKCRYYEIPFLESYESEELSRAIGKRNVKIIGITDEGFASSMLSKRK